MFTVELTNCEMGLLVLLLLEDTVKNGSPMEYQDILNGEKANSSELMAKLITIRSNIKKVNKEIPDWSGH